MATQIGGKDTSRQPKKKLPLLIIGISHDGPKDAKGAPTHGSNGGVLPDKPDASDDDDSYAGKGPGGKTIKPGEAQFNNQTEVCSKCEYFDPEGNNGVGECKMGVPEADFETSDPDASHCKYFSEDEDKETPEEEKAENEPEENGQ